MGAPATRVLHPLHTNAQIDADDDKYIVELLRDAGDGPLDLHLETNGGYTDAAEKIITLLGPYRDRLRVIVPRRAKSNGTLLALAASEIIMGAASELGPIDPFIILGPGQAVPAHFVLQAPGVDPVIHQIATHAVGQTQKLATDLLTSGQMKNNIQAIGLAVEALSSRNTYPSHGSVIDHQEASRLGLCIKYLEPSSEDWGWCWFLRCLYEQDGRRSNFVKIFEGPQVSTSVRQVAA